MVMSQVSLECMHKLTLSFTMVNRDILEECNALLPHCIVSGMVYTRGGLRGTTLCALIAKLEITVWHQLGKILYI